MLNLADSLPDNCLDYLNSQTVRYRVRRTPGFRDRDRFRVEILENNGKQILRVIDRLADNRLAQPLFEWRGAIAQHLYKCGVLGADFLQSRVQYRDKSFVQHLALAAASAEMAGERARDYSHKPVFSDRRFHYPAESAFLAVLKQTYTALERVSRSRRKVDSKIFSLSRNAVGVWPNN